MKKILIIPAIAALTLCACGGNTNQNSNNGAAAVQTPQCDVSTTPDESPEPVGIAYDVLKAIANEGKYGLEKDADLRYFFRCDESGNCWNPESLHNNQYGSVLDLLPLNNGEYLVMYEYTIQLSDTEEYGDCTLIYKDGELESAYNILPRPDARFFYSNYLQFPVTELQLLQRAMGCIYSIKDDKLCVTLDPYYDLKDDYPETMKKFLEQDSPTITFKWKDGEFVPDPENQAVELDLYACFGIESDEVRKKKILAALPKHYTDSVYEFSTERVDVDADFHSGYSDYYFPYKNKEGEYFVLSVFSQSSAGASSCDFSCFNYKDGKTEDLENFLPVPDVNDFVNKDQCEDDPDLCNELKQTYKEYSKPYSCDYFSYDKSLRYFLFFEDEELDVKFYDLTNDVEVKYKWNGEKFEKINE